jgi:hypothetical protein
VCALLLQALAAVSLLVAAALLAAGGRADRDGEAAGRVEMSPHTWEALKARAREGHLMPHAAKATERRAEMRSAMSHLSSSSLVQRAAAACARETNCVPTVNELVKRAAAACSKDPSCVCDWGKHPKQCFLSEVQRHKQLKKDAKALVRQINARAATDKVKKVVVSELEHEEESFEEVLQDGRKALGAGDFEQGKSDLAKAEYLHELAVRKTGDATGPVMERQERLLKSFAREIVEAEAEHSARNRARGRRNDDAGRGQRGRSAGISVVEQQIKALSSNVEKLMHKVGTMEQKNEIKRQMAEAGVYPGARSNPKAQVKNLVKEIAILTGKLGDVEHPHGKGAAAPGERKGQRPESPAEARFGAEALAHEESQFAEAIARGERAAFKGKTDEAHMALQEARYYHSEIVRLKGEPRAAPCLPCQQLERSVLRVKRNQDGAPSEKKGREQQLVQVVGSEAQVIRQDNSVRAVDFQHKSTAAIESDFDAALSQGERARIKGNREVAEKQEGIAQSALLALDRRRLPHGDKLVKHEMSDALDSFERGVRKMPEPQQQAKRAGRELAERVVRAEKGKSEEGGRSEARQLRHAEQQQRQGSKFVDHLLYGDKKSAHAHHGASTRGQQDAFDGARHAQDPHAARARLQRKAHAMHVARAQELREAAESDDASRHGSERAHGRLHEGRYEREMDSRRRRAELERAALRDDREFAHRDAARRRLQRRGRRRREEGPAEREGRGWEGRREEEAREIKEHETREHLPAYRRQTWEQAPLPKSLLSRIYSHFSSN